ncbi:MAG: hypothetical protein GWN71_43750, partial [Gammaproteobacteria bacterium]|nr:hypothetical protein [Gammaproteobacteria bacterium]NIW38205.1 hypothetical protein [Gemmatimonadota bacterium]NIY13040.1 hypothetical protein [Gemmatimonadota bacterium]
MFCCPLWGSDGNLYFTSAGDVSIYRIPAEGGAKERVFERSEDEGGHFWFTLLPDQRSGTFQIGGTPPRIEAIDLDSGERTPLTTGE